VRGLRNPAGASHGDPVGDMPVLLVNHGGCARTMFMTEAFAADDAGAGRTRGGSGASRTRTGDLLGAIQALSQLSYSPASGQCSRAGTMHPCGAFRSA
jgi:hypothetical protein